MSNILSWTSLVFLHFAAFYSSSLFFQHYLYKDYHVKNKWVKYLFSATLATSFCMLCLLIMEISMGDALSRRAVWQLDMVIILLLVYLVIPAGFVYSVSNLYAPGSILIFLCGIAIFLPFFWIIFYKSGSILKISKFEFSSHQLYSRIAVFGVVLVSGLSGFGAVQYPLGSFFLENITKEETSKLEDGLLHTLKVLSNAKSVKKKETQQKWWAKEDEEVTALEIMAEELFKSLQEAIEARAQQLSRNTLFGRIKSFAAFFMAIAYRDVV
eukprot:GHVL01031754.1.p1 GENE.GHVL01031754.1~~GHVL01031754.1.p1  ORF type:complete len:269 (-),score=37.75 GHVL01031754.1:535-1341(-)